VTVHIPFTDVSNIPFFRKGKVVTYAIEEQPTIAHPDHFEYMHKSIPYREGSFLCSYAPEKILLYLNSLSCEVMPMYSRNGEELIVTRSGSHALVPKSWWRPLRNSYVQVGKDFFNKVEGLLAERPLTEKEYDEYAVVLWGHKWKDRRPIEGPDFVGKVGIRLGPIEPLLRPWY